MGQKHLEIVLCNLLRFLLTHTVTHMAKTVISKHAIKPILTADIGSGDVPLQVIGK